MCKTFPHLHRNNAKHEYPSSRTCPADWVLSSPDQAAGLKAADLWCNVSSSPVVVAPSCAAKSNEFSIGVQWIVIQCTQIFIRVTCGSESRGKWARIQAEARFVVPFLLFSFSATTTVRFKNGLIAHFLISYSWSGFRRGHTINKQLSADLHSQPRSISRAPHEEEKPAAEGITVITSFTHAILIQPKRCNQFGGVVLLEYVIISTEESSQIKEW